MSGVVCCFSPFGSFFGTIFFLPTRLGLLLQVQAVQFLFFLPFDGFLVSTPPAEKAKRRALKELPDQTLSKRMVLLMVKTV